MCIYNDLCALQFVNAHQRKDSEDVAARINLSIPDDLKTRMDQITDVNWSKVAQDSFETYVRIHELKEKSMLVDAGIERLRASKQTNAEREEAEGVAMGKKWGLEMAEYDELKRVADARESVTGEDIREFAETITGEETIGWNDAANTMNDVFGTKSPSPDMILGFVIGASEIFDQI